MIRAVAIVVGLILAAAAVVAGLQLAERLNGGSEGDDQIIGSWPA